MIYLHKINYQKIECPFCKNKGTFTKNLETGDIECQCGLIIQTNNQYVAGQKINLELSYIIERRQK